VEMDHSEIDSITHYLLSEECHLLTNKKGLNDMMIMWLMREGRGFAQTMRHLKHLNRLGCHYGSVRELNTGIRRSNRTVDDLNKFLAGEGKALLTTPLAPTDDLFATVEEGGASTYTIGFTQQLQKEGKKLSNIKQLGPTIAGLKTQAFDQLMEFFSDMECTLLNVVDNISDSQLADLLVAGGGAAGALRHLHSLNDNHRTFLSFHDLVEAVHTKSGIAVLVL